MHDGSKIREQFTQEKKTLQKLLISCYPPAVSPCVTSRAMCHIPSQSPFSWINTRMSASHGKRHVSGHRLTCLGGQKDSVGISKDCLADKTWMCSKDVLKRQRFRRCCEGLGQQKPISGDCLAGRCCEATQGWFEPLRGTRVRTRVCMHCSDVRKQQKNP